MLNPEIAKFKLAVSCPCIDDGTSLVRGEGPLGAMARHDRRLEIDHAPTIDGNQMLSWSWIHRNDALLLQRPFRPEDVRAAVHAKMMQRPVWVDWDDDLTSVPPHNPYHHLYDHAKMRQTIAKLATLADVVTVTTERLAERIKEVSGLKPKVSSPPGAPPTRDLRLQTADSKLLVLPNACHWPRELERSATIPRQRRVTWRGGKSHNEDILEFLPAIAELARLPQFSQWKWCFLGEPPWQVKQALPAERLEFFAEDIFHYLPSFGYLAPWVNIVPLKDDLFNRSKSNLAWIEGTCAGAITLAPDWYEWWRPGVVNYKSSEEFKKVLRGVMSEIRTTTPYVERSRDYIRRELLLDHVNAARWKILNNFAAERGSMSRSAAGHSPALQESAVAK